MHHIFIKENQIRVNDKEIEINKNDDFNNYNHLANVLRVKNGEYILCSVESFKMPFDYKSKVMSLDENSILLEIEEKTDANELPVSVNLYQGITKSDKFEFIIEKATELGVKEIFPLSTKFCVAKIEEDKKGKKLERYNKISKSAAEQSKRHIIPEVKEPISFNNMVTKINSENNVNLLFYENVDGIENTKNIIENIKTKMNNNIKDLTVNVIIGPEGGFSEEEINLAKDNNINILSLGKRILRTETAAAAALSIIMYELER